jgi:LmbE family N-acetylglucosaminyl deacetylase
MAIATNKNREAIIRMKQLIKSGIRKLHIGWLRHRCAGAQQISCAGRIVIVAPHPDDEVIGCGGLIAHLVAEGRAPHVVVMTGGEGSHSGCCATDAESIRSARRGLTRKALSLLGVPEENLHELNFPDGKISTEHAEMNNLRALLARLSPDCVFVPHWGEGWPDHVRTAQIVKEMLSEHTNVWEYCVWMWYYNVWRGLDWKNAACFTMAEDEHAKKLRAMNAYITPLAPCGRPWSGVLPHLFVSANRWNKELYFKVPANLRKTR